MGSESDSELSEQSKEGLATMMDLFMPVTGMTESNAKEEAGESFLKDGFAIRIRTGRFRGGKGRKD